MASSGGGRSAPCDGDRGAQRGPDRRGRFDGDLGGGGGAQPVDPGPDPDLPEPSREPGDLLRRQPADGGQVGPLVLVRLQRGEVEEDGGAAAAGAAGQRCGDEVAQPADGHHVLGGEEPVVAGQVHPPAHGDRLAEQPAADLPGGGRWNRGGEEQPHVGALPGPGDLQRGGCPGGSGGLEVGQRVQHRGGAVEVGGQPATAVAVQQRIEAQLQLPGQVRGDHLLGQRQVLPLRGRHALAPAAPHRRRPARPPRARVLPAQRVHVPAGAEQRRVEGDLRRGG